MKNIVVSIRNEKDLAFFDEVVKEYPGDISVLKKRGFDTVALFQIVVDASVAMVPHFLTALGLFLTYKIEQKKNKATRTRIEFRQRKIRKRKEKIRKTKNTGTNSSRKIRNKD